jgi:hypothetical protein
VIGPPDRFLCLSVVGGKIIEEEVPAWRVIDARSFCRKPE